MFVRFNKHPPGDWDRSRRKGRNLSISSKLKSLSHGAFTAVAVSLLFVAGSGVSQAVEPEPEVFELVRISPEGSITPVEPGPPLSAGPSLENGDAGDQSGTITPYLLSPAQWADCWTFNNANAVFASYAWPRNGVATMIDLKCGNSSYGYKHIVGQGHDQQWGTVFNKAKAAGWDNANYRVNSWDDLMSMADANLIGSNVYDYENINTISNKACRNGSFGLWSTTTHTLVYTFRVEMVWSINNKRVITSYPSSRSICNA